MKFGRHDIRNLAIIGACAAAGLVATGIVIDAVEGPHVQYERIVVEREQIRSVEFNVRTVPIQPRTTRTARIRVRGSSDASPVVYIDGVRVNTGPRCDFYPTHHTHHGAEPTGHLDDLTPEDIAKIDVVKGDRALEFGTEGKERGVILITTKEGRKKGSGEKKDSGEKAEKGP